MKYAALIALFACADAAHDACDLDADPDTDTDAGVDTDTDTDDPGTTIGTRIMYIPEAIPAAPDLGGMILQVPIGTTCQQVVELVDDNGVLRLLPNRAAVQGEIARGGFVNGDGSAVLYKYTARCDQMNWDIRGASCISEQLEMGDGIVIGQTEPYEVVIDSTVWTQGGIADPCP